MLTYRDEELEFDQDIKKNNTCKYCCFSSIFCLLIIAVLLFIFGLQSICLVPFINQIDLCKEMTNFTEKKENTTNFTTVENTTNFTEKKENTTNFTNIENTTNFTEKKENTNNITEKKEISDNPNLNMKGLTNITNVSNSFFINQAIIPETNIEQNNQEKKDYGEAIGISIGSVFGFIILTGGFVYGLKKGPSNIKQFCTYRTASRHNTIQLTDEELKFYQVKNPLQEAIDNNQGGHFVEAVNILKKAIEKDRAREFKEAISLYNKGIDIVIKCLKSDFNSNDRFAIAKKIDIYVQRVNYITNCVENEKLVQDIKI